MAESGSARERREEGKKGEEEEEDDVVCLDPSFFVDRSYEMTTFTFGSQVLHLLCLRAASTDYDLTGQLVWPGAVLMNTYLSEHPETVKDHSVIELGSGIIKKNIEMQSCSGSANAVLTAEKLEWGNYVHISNIIEKHPSGFDLILGADIYILLFYFARGFFVFRPVNVDSYWLMYHELNMDVLVVKEAEKHGMHVKEVDGTRTTISNLEGVIYDITLK
uniref:Methyltransferase type 11 domain-containing protein n=1 Tax=Oryza punctata TaxID=4537 RepID=A0A0E0LNY4_ORYPU